MRQVSIPINKSKIAGLLIGIPIAFPAPPFYLLSLLAFLLCINDIKINDRNEYYLFVICISLIGLTFLSQIISPFSNIINPLNIISTGGFFILFLFGLCVRDVKNLIYGYCFSMTLVATLIIILFFILKPYRYGILMFVYPDVRMWAVEVVPDWPNFMSFGLSLAFLLSTLYLGNKKMSLLLFIAAILTTSRISILASAIFSISVFRKYPKLVICVGFIILFIGLYIYEKLNIDIELINQLWERMSKTSDRETGFNFLIEDLFLKSPIFGVGGVKVSDLPNFPPNFTSYHNSYLEVLVRFGVISLVLFLLMIFPWKFFSGTLSLNLFLIISFSLISALFQNILKHPSYFMIYSIIILRGFDLDELARKT